MDKQLFYIWFAFLGGHDEGRILKFVLIEGLDDISSIYILKV